MAKPLSSQIRIVRIGTIDSWFRSQSYDDSFGLMLIWFKKWELVLVVMNCINYPGYLLSIRVSFWIFIFNLYCRSRTIFLPLSKNDCPCCALTDRKSEVFIWRQSGWFFFFNWHLHSKKITTGSLKKSKHISALIRFPVLIYLVLKILKRGENPMISSGIAILVTIIREGYIGGFMKKIFSNKWIVLFLLLTH